MFYRRVLSTRSDSLISSSDSNNKVESVITGSEKLRLKPFSSDDQPRRNLTVFDQMGAAVLQCTINPAHRHRQFGSWIAARAFGLHAQVAPTRPDGGLNTRNVTTSWLAAAHQETHSRVEDIANYSHCCCIPCHKCGRKIERGDFGLAYNMADKTGIEYPILATNWKSALWTDPIFPKVTKGITAWSGLQKYAKSPKWANSKEASFIRYSYNLKDFKEGYAMLSNHTVHSTANCSLIEIGDGQYWRWGNGNRTGPFSK
ncbi:hypothetical protein HOY82DRAFT_644957 [Tuber indicum]|nr:hypothetical protein HOY82DRAFT_644957 [Tuber indicum]